MSLELFYVILHKVLYGLLVCPYRSELFLQDTLLLSDSQESAICRVLDFKASWTLLFLTSWMVMALDTTLFLNFWLLQCVF